MGNPQKPVKMSKISTKFRPNTAPPPTQLRLLSDWRIFCTFADVVEYPDGFDSQPEGMAVPPMVQHLYIIIMGKLTSLNGKVVGKIGAIVYSTNAGQIIGREYNPNVANPNTQAQVDQRARLKLASQLAAALAPVIAIPRDGMKSPRNQFIKLNMAQIIANDGVAQVSYENLQLTSGNAGLPTITATRDAQNALTLALQSSADASVSRVVYIVYKKSSENTLQFIHSSIVSVAGDAGTFPTTIANMAGELVIFAYGMKDLSAAASAKYGNYSVTDGQDIARLVMTRNLSAGDYQFTRTRGTTLFSGESEVITPDDDQFMVYITASGSGTVAGNGFTNGRKAVNAGDSVTLTATANSGSTFVGWRYSGESTNFSTENPLTLPVNNNLDIVGVFNTPSSGDLGQN